MEKKGAAKFRGKRLKVSLLFQFLLHKTIERKYE